MLYEELALYQDYNTRFGCSGLLPVVVFIASVMRRLPIKAYTSVREEITMVDTRGGEYIPDAAYVIKRISNHYTSIVGPTMAAMDVSASLPVLAALQANRVNQKRGEKEIHDSRLPHVPRSGGAPQGGKKCVVCKAPIPKFGFTGKPVPDAAEK